MDIKITLEMAKEKILQALIDAEIGTYTTMYALDKAVVTISNLMKLTGLTKYGARKALKALQMDGLIYYTSQGCQAVVSYGECPELVFEAGPPINGYTLTEDGFHTKQWIDSYEAWKEGLEEWANGKENISE